ncbi:MAG: hypothetical protein JSU96_03665 [Acidobacteriota bacterium]|nr:MAG: hypothetical protein JSU96_03665 [Acidobacteriota bacterium]
MYSIGRRNQRKRDQTEIYLSYSYLGPIRASEISPFPLIQLNETTIQPGAEFQIELLPDTDLLLYPLEQSFETAPAEGEFSLVENGKVCRVTTAEEASFLQFRNPSKNQKCRFLEFWIGNPPESCEPSFEVFDVGRQKGFFAFFPIASGQSHENALPLHGDLAFYLSSLRPNENLIFETTMDRKSFVFVIDGSVKVEEDRIITGDTAILYRQTPVELSAQQRTILFFVDLPE